jgi:hypothetical protein
MTLDLTNLPCFFTSKETFGPARKGWVDSRIPGDHTGRETPDPIPNSEAKTVRPMIVLWAKVGDCQDYEGLYLTVQALSFWGSIEQAVERFFLAALIPASG